jgi:flagellar basal-body rod modification protein FlgD
MSAISSSTAGTAVSTSTDAFSSLKSDDFVRIIFTELANQDPLAPNETSDLLDQISTLRQIESDQDFTKTLDSLVKQNELTAASTLIGKLATGLNASANRVVGFVDSISVSEEGTTLNLSTGERLPFNNVDEIIDPSLFNDGEDGPTPVDETEDTDDTPDDPPTDDPPADDPPGDDPPGDDPPEGDG